MLSLNTLYFDSERAKHDPDLSKGTSIIGIGELEWIREQLTEDSDRKFILCSHVYPGARYKDFQLWNNPPNIAYFEIIEKHRDRILMELAGHDHLASLRAAMTHDHHVFHNIFIAPSITPWYGNNPGVTSF